MRTNGFRTPLGGLLILGIFCASPDRTWPQDQKSDLDLTWKLRVDQAANYEAFDSLKGGQLQDLCLLGGELEKRVGATQISELPLRFLFRSPRAKVRTGSRWEVSDMAFGELPVEGPNVGPVSVSGGYVVKGVKKLRIAEALKACGRGKKDKGDPVEVAVIDGQFQVYRCNWVGAKVMPAEKTPSATFTTVAYVRVSDGAIVGGQFQLSGRIEDYRGSWTGPAATKGTVAQEFGLKEPLQDLTKKGLQESVNRAIEKGARWLSQQQLKDGVITDRSGYAIGTSHGGGSTALALLALLHSGVPDKDPIIRQGFAYLATQRFIMTYDLGSILMAMEAKYLPMSWVDDLEIYSEDKARTLIAGKITTQDKDLVAAWTSRLVENQGESGMFGYSKGGDTDNLSTTQYAVLGLKSASRMGAKIPTSVWKKVLTYLENAQVLSGSNLQVKVEYKAGSKADRSAPVTGWGYLHPSIDQPTGTMVSAALATLAIARSELDRAKEWDTRCEQFGQELEWGGLAWLQNTWSIRSGTPEGCLYVAAMPYYYLYSIERALILNDVVKLGGHDWYHEGAAVLLSWQRGDGHWEGFHGTPVIDTAFALLFLKRATIPVETPSRKGLRTGDSATGESGKKNTDTTEKPDRAADDTSKDK